MFPSLEPPRKFSREARPEQQEKAASGLNPRSFHRIDPQKVQDSVAESGAQPLWPHGNPAQHMLRQTDQILARSVPGMRRR